MNLALDRIICFEHSKEEFIPNIAIDFVEYFEDIIGVTLPEKTESEKIILKVDAIQWPYIKTKPLHGSQKVQERNDHFIVIELELVPNYELEAVLFSFGDHIEILKPDELKNSFKERLKNLYLKYY